MSDIIVHEGKKYRKVERNANVGDLIMIVSAIKENYPVGAIGKCTRNDEFDDGSIDTTLSFPGSETSGFIDTVYAKYVVLEPVGAADLYALESELAAMKAKVAEMERQLAEAKVADRLKVGDYAVVLKAPGRLEIGDLVEITHEDAGGFDYNARRVLDGRTEVFQADELRRATDEEVAEAQRKLAEKENAEKWAAIGRKPGEFKVGDVARPHSMPELGLAEVVEIDGDYIRVKYADETGYGTCRDHKTFHTLVAPVESVVNLRVS
jgi:hypothetical protein